MTITAHRGRRLYLLGLFCVLAAVLAAAAGCGGSATTATTGGAGGAQGAGSGATSASIPAGATTLAMKNTTFVPADVTIKVGQTVAWVNDVSSCLRDALGCTPPAPENRSAPCRWRRA